MAEVFTSHRAATAARTDGRRRHRRGTRTVIIAEITGTIVGHRGTGGSETALTEETGAIIANGDATETGDKGSAAVNEEPVAYPRRVLA